MSATAFAGNSMEGRREPITQASVQKMLDENTQLIQAIIDYQSQGKARECAQYQQLLHRNLIFLATLADSTLNQQQTQQAPVQQQSPAQQQQAQHQALQQQAQQQQQATQQQQHAAQQHHQQTQQQAVQQHMMQQHNSMQNIQTSNAIVSAMNNNTSSNPNAMNNPVVSTQASTSAASASITSSTLGANLPTNTISNSTGSNSNSTTNTVGNQNSRVIIQNATSNPPEMNNANRAMMPNYSHMSMGNASMAGMVMGPLIGMPGAMGPNVPNMLPGMAGGPPEMIQNMLMQQQMARSMQPDVSQYGGNMASNNMVSQNNMPPSSSF